MENVADSTVVHSGWICGSGANNFDWHDVVSALR